LSIPTKEKSMFKRKNHRILAMCAFCFGVAFSLSAFAATCEECWQSCFAQRVACRAAGTPASVCLINYNACGRACGCQIP
jgi:hypothetical protein